MKKFLNERNPTYNFYCAVITFSFHFISDPE
jgi:hypothetical protein